LRFGGSLFVGFCKRHLFSAGADEDEDEEKDEEARLTGA
jgi:hypothetical protein